MLVCFAGTWLTNDGTGTFSERAITSTMEASFNGKQIVQDAQFLRAAFAQPIARSNKSNVFTFKVSREFKQLNPSAPNPLALAESFAATHFSNLPTTGLLAITCGGYGTTAISVTSVNAVLEETPEIDIEGVRVTVTYSLRCGQLVNNGGIGGAPSTVTYDCGVMPVTYADPFQTIDGGNMTDTFIGSPSIDCGLLV